MTPLNEENTTQNIRKPAGEELELQEIVINRPTMSNPILKTAANSLARGFLKLNLLIPLINF